MGSKEVENKKSVDKAKKILISNLYPNREIVTESTVHLYGELSASFHKTMKKYPGMEYPAWNILTVQKNADSQVKLSFGKDPVLLDQGRLFIGSKDIMMHLSNEEEKKMIKEFEQLLETLNSLVCQYVIADSLELAMDAEEKKRLQKHNEDINKTKEDIKKRLTDALKKYENALAEKPRSIVELTHFSTISFIHKVFPDGSVSGEVAKFEKWCKENLKTAGRTG